LKQGNRRSQAKVEVWAETLNRDFEKEFVFFGDFLLKMKVSKKNSRLEFANVFIKINSNLEMEDIFEIVKKRNNEVFFTFSSLFETSKENLFSLKVSMFLL